MAFDPGLRGLLSARVPAVLAVAAVLLFGLRLSAQPVASWSFETATPAATSDGVSQIPDKLIGADAFVRGVRGQCLVLDGMTTHVVRSAARAPKIAGSFTVQAWAALGSYPLKEAPIVDFGDPARGGFVFGVDAHGRLMLALKGGDRWQKLTAPAPLSLRSWHRVAAVFDPAGGMRLYNDGARLAQQPVEGAFIPPAGLDLLIGRSRVPQQPEGTIRPEATAAVFDYLDGALDELKIFDHALPDSELLQAVRTGRSPTSPLGPRVLPVGVPATGPFGAFSTRLWFYTQWERGWRVGPFPDVVVRFDTLPIHLVFWRGTSYIPNWVTENGIWYNNQSTETWTGVRGCGEPMSDKQCRYSNVRVIESTDARAVVHWRYALADVFNTIARPDPITGLGDWTDEIHTIYPDGTAVRMITLHSTQPAEPHEWQESIVVMGPGFRPETVLEPAGLTMLNAAGESVTYSWKTATPPAEPGQPAAACIQLVNTKSRFKPFALVRPQDEPTFDIYAGEVRRDVSMYPWWNHWPAAAFASDGRYALADDRPSHSALAHLKWKAYRVGRQSMTKIMLTGLSDQPAAKLLPMLRAWSRPAPIKIASPGYTTSGFDPTEKAYQIQRLTDLAAPLTFELKAGAESPLVNPVFVIQNWGAGAADVILDGLPLRAARSSGRESGAACKARI